MNVVHLDPRRIHPFDQEHAIEDCVQRIAASMKETGWGDHRPLLIEEVGGGLPLTYQAWTGTHRILAARKAGLSSVPCRLMAHYELQAAFVPHYGIARWHEYGSWAKSITGNDERRRKALEEVGLRDAAAMLREEIDATDGCTSKND
jgi:hypothetical protein